MSAFGSQLNFLVNQMQKAPPPQVPPTADAVSLGGDAVPLPASVPIHLSKPANFSGDSGDCTAFLIQCGLHFKLQAAAIPSDRARVAYLVSHLTGRAEAQATTDWNRGSPICNSLALFIQSFTQIF